MKHQTAPNSITSGPQSQRDYRKTLPLTFFDRYNQLVSEGSFPADITDLSFASRSSYELPRYAAAFFNVSRDAESALISLSASIDLYVRGIDTLSDAYVEDPQKHSERMQFASLFLLDSISHAEAQTSISIISKLKEYMTIASAADRKLVKLQESNQVCINTEISLKLMAQKNYSLMIVPYVAARTYRADFGNKFKDHFHNLFLVTQLIDDFLDAEEDFRQGRCTYLGSKLRDQEKSKIPSVDKLPKELILGYFEFVEAKARLEYNLMPGNIRNRVENFFRECKENSTNCESYTQFKDWLVASMPPVFAYH